MNLELRPEWGSGDPEHRLKIRRRIDELYGPVLDSDILDLKIPPKLKFGFISISHAPGLGGFVHHGRWVGLDVEVTTRVTPAIAARAGSMEEFLAAPDPASLWCAKEAVFKALRFARPPRTVFEFSLIWSLGQHGAGFQILDSARFGAAPGEGRIAVQGEHTIATFSTHAV